jgi:hypothetical protein
MPRSVQALGWAPRRLELITRLVGAVPVRRIVYPDGFQHLPVVRQAILADLQHL